MTLSLLRRARAALDLTTHEECPCPPCYPGLATRRDLRADLDGVLTAPATVFYLCHPVAPLPAELAASDDMPSHHVHANVKRALRWLRWCRQSMPTATVVAPWIAGLLCGEDDADPAQRERGLRDCEAVAARCDGIVLVGGRISTGMRREMDAVIAAGGEVLDLTALGEEPPEDPRQPLTFTAPDRTEES